MSCNKHFESKACIPCAIEKSVEKILAKLDGSKPKRVDVDSEVDVESIKGKLEHEKKLCAELKENIDYGIEEFAMRKSICRQYQDCLDEIRIKNERHSRTKIE